MNTCDEQNIAMALIIGLANRAVHRCEARAVATSVSIAAIQVAAGTPKRSAVKKRKMSLDVITQCVPGIRTGHSPVKITIPANAITFAHVNELMPSNCGNVQLRAANPHNVIAHQQALAR